MESQEIDLNKVTESGEEKESFELWKVPLKKGGDVLKFEEGTYKILFKNDGEKVEGKFGEQVELLVEGWDVSTEEKFDGVWLYLSANTRNRCMVNSKSSEERTRYTAGL